MSSTGLFARAAPAAKPPTRSLLRPELFLSWTFLVPFLASAGVTFFFATNGPVRHEAVLRISVPRPQTRGVEIADTFVDPVLMQEEVAPLAVFFRSPERMRGALLAVDPRAGAAGEPRLQRVSRRLANQVTVAGRESSPADRILVDIRLWSTRGDLPAPLLAYLGDELVRRSNRLDSILDQKSEELQSRRDAQAARVEASKDSVRSLLQEHLPEGLDAPFDQLVEGQDWPEVLRQNFRRARADGDPLLGALTRSERIDDGSADSEITESQEGSIETTDATPPDAEGKIRSLASLRRRMRALRTEIAREEEVLRDLDRQVERLADRSQLIGHESQEKVRVENEPASASTERSSAWIALMAATIGVAAGSLSLLLRLFLIDLRAPALPGD